MTASGSQSRDRLFRRKANPSLAPRRDVRVWVVLVRTVKDRSEIHYMRYILPFSSAFI